MIRCPGCPYHIPIANFFILQWGLGIGGDHPVKARRPETGEILKSPLVVREPIDSDGICLLCYLAYGFWFNLVREESREEYIRLLAFHCRKECLVHAGAAELNNFLIHWKIIYISPIHPRKSVPKVGMLIGESAAGISVIVLKSDVENFHRFFENASKYFLATDDQ